MSLPVPITGPVGRPVVEPPGGSSETASTALFFARPARSPESVSVTGCIGAQQAHWPWSAIGRDQPELGHARCVGAEGGGDDGDGAALHVDGRHEMTLAAAFDRCDERLLFA